MNCLAKVYLAGQSSLEEKKIFRNLLELLFTVLRFAILAEVVLSWIMRGQENKVTQVIHTISEPFMAPARKLQEKFINGLPIDFSPIIALLFLNVIQNLIFSFI
jgi:YggT family protein